MINRIFALIWVVWFANVGVALFMPHAPLYGLIVLLSFFLFEIPAAMRKGNRDTLSEIVTWAMRKQSRTRLPISWGAVLGVIVTSISWLVGRTVVTYTGSLLFGAVIGLLVLSFLWFHFMHPDIYG